MNSGAGPVLLDLCADEEISLDVHKLLGDSAIVLERGDHSWSLENVATRATRALFSELEAAHPERVAWAVFDSADFGAPQSRVRLIAGPKKLIRMLQGMPCSRRVSIRDAFAERGEVPPASYCKNQTRSHGGGPTTRSVEVQSFTVCAGHALTWCGSDGQTVRVMTARDSSILMGFPSSWRLPKGSRVSQRAVGNAVCVALSKAITLAAIAVLNGDAAVITPPPMQQTTKKRTIAEVSRGEYDALRQRVDALEESLSPYASNTS